MPARTVTLGVVALTEEANRRIAATGRYFDDLRAKNPVELTVKLNRAQALAESKILAKEMAATVTDTLKLDIDRGGLGGIPVIGRLFRGGSGPGAGLPGPLGNIPGIGTLPPVVSGPAGIGAVVAALAAIPFLAQAAAGAITLGLGGALTGIGVYAASKSKDVQKSFKDLQTAAAADFGGIGTPFNKAIEGILKTAQGALPALARTFTAAITPIAGPLQQFGQQFVRVLADPQVAASLKAVGQAFGGILKALTPQLAGDAAAIADGITNIARAVARNPKAIADFISSLAHLAGIAFDVIAWLTNLANYIEHHWKPILTGAIAPILDHWSGLVTFFTVTLPGAFRGVVIAALRTAEGIAGAFAWLPGPLGKPFRAAHDAIAAELAKIDGSAARTAANIKTAWDLLNGLTANLYVYTNFVNVGSPPGGIFPTPTGLPPGVSPGTVQPGRRAAAFIPAAARGPGAPASVNVTLQVSSTGQSDFDRFMTTWLQKSVTVRGGGSVQAAWGTGTG